jgi:hypothetical protein
MSKAKRFSYIFGVLATVCWILAAINERGTIFYGLVFIIVMWYLILRDRFKKSAEKQVQ